MTDNTSRGRPGTPAQGPTGMPVRLVRGDASPEELSAVVAIVAVLAAADSENDPGQTDRPSPGNEAPPRSPWSAPARTVRTTYPHGPGGWRASASPR
jgi:hypothetical protein